MAEQQIDFRPPSRARRTIAHADLDAFYASVEVLDNPQWRGLPVIVGGLGARGVVASASYEARRFGVRSAMPIAQARKICPQAIFVRPRMERYLEVARSVREIFASLSPLVEPLSVDEAFIDLTGTERLLGAPEAAARLLKRRIRAEIGLTVSIGVGPTKMVAKILSELSKPDGLLIIGPDDVRDFLAQLPVERLWGVGRVTLHRLNQMGISTVGALARCDPAWLKARLGSLGVRLQALANGEDPRPVISVSRRSSYGEETTFERDHTLSSPFLRFTLASQAENLATRLRAEGVKANRITLKLKLSRALGEGRYPVITKSRALTPPSDDGLELERVVLELLASVRREESVRLAGVQVGIMDGGENPQLALFSLAQTRERERRAHLNRAIDGLERRFGKGVIRRGSIAGTS